MSRVLGLEQDIFMEEKGKLDILNRTNNWLASEQEKSDNQLFAIKSRKGMVTKPLNREYKCRIIE